MKRFTITALVMVIVSVSLLFMLGAADNGAAAASGEEANSVYDAMIGAKNVQLALGAYVSEPSWSWTHRRVLQSRKRKNWLTR